MDAPNHEPGDLARELRALGQNLKEIFSAAWESEDRRRVQAELEEGLSELAAALRSAAEGFANTETGQRLKEDMRELEERVRSGETSSRIREDLLASLRTVNAELGRAAREMGGRSGSGSAGEEGEG